MRVRLDSRYITGLIAITLTLCTGGLNHLLWQTQEDRTISCGKALKVGLTQKLKHFLG